MKDYLTADTFDVTAKTMFAREFLFAPRDRSKSWAYEVYSEHLRVWNGFLEGDKKSLWDFVTAFGNLLWDMQDGKFDWERSPIPTFEGKICNGRHRLAAALVLDQHIRTVDVTDDEPSDCTYDTLRKAKLDEWYLDSMAIEYCRLRTEARIAVVFGPHDRGHMAGALADAGQVFYEKTVRLDGIEGPLNLIRELYLGEDWLPTHGAGKAQACFPRGRGLVTFYGVDVMHPEALLGCKWNIRQDLGRGNDSLHVNDTHEETMRLANAFFNQNGIHFLNHARGHVRVPAHARTHVSIDSGAVLAAYGLRPAADVDFVDEDLHMEFHGVPLEMLLDDPHNFFWSAGVKYASIPAVRRMKENRGEEKDKRDLVLMEGL